MYTLENRIKAEVNWVTTSTTVFSEYGKDFEVVTYSDGELLLWDSVNNTSLHFSVREVDQLRKIIEGRKIFKVKPNTNGKLVPVKSTRATIPLPIVDTKEIEEVVPHSSNFPFPPELQVIANPVVMEVPPTEVIVHEELPPVVIPTEAVNTPVVTLPEVVNTTEATEPIVEVTVPKKSTKHISKKAKESMEKHAAEPSIVKDIPKILNTKPVPKDTSKATPRVRTKPTVGDVKQIMRELKGWGVNVMVKGKQVRYYYQTRATAREADKNHVVGESGRIL